MRLSLPYVAELCDGCNELYKAESAWKAVRQKEGDSFEPYEVNEQQSFQIYHALSRSWVGLPPVTDHERAVALISHADSSLVQAYTKILHKDYVFPSSLTFVEVCEGLANLYRKLSIKYP